MCVLCLCVCACAFACVSPVTVIKFINFDVLSNVATFICVVHAEVLLRVIITEQDRVKILTAIHEGLGSTDEAHALGGHIGRDKTMSKLQERYENFFRCLLHGYHAIFI